MSCDCLYLGNMSKDIEAINDSYLSFLREIPGSTEIVVGRENILRHILRYDEPFPLSKKYLAIPASNDPPIIRSKFYSANIGSLENPVMLELRNEPRDVPVSAFENDRIPYDANDDRVRINLLMTNERHPAFELMKMAEYLYKAVEERGIKYDAIIAPETLGSKLSEAMSIYAWNEEGRDIYATSLQKGKPRVEKIKNNLPVRSRKNWKLVTGSPKPFVDEKAGLGVASGTSRSGTEQKLYLDQQIAGAIAKYGWRTLIVDDARLTQGTINTSIRLLKQMDIPVAGVATVLNEGDPTDYLGEIPFVWLTKLPMNKRVLGGYQPIRGTYDGLDYFYIELPK